MTEFQSELTDRARSALQQLAQAREAGDDYLAHVRVGELESIARLAAEHDVDLPELDEFRSPAA
ncbi:MAG: hypothetical protein ACR2JN_08745 [Lapillicoccus sp.]